MSSSPFLSIAALHDMDPADAHMLVAVTPAAYRQGGERAGLRGVGNVSDTVWNAAQRALTRVYPDLRPERVHVRRLEHSGGSGELERVAADLLADGGRQVTQVLVLDEGDWSVDVDAVGPDVRRALGMVPKVSLDYSAQTGMSFEDYVALRLNQRGAGVLSKSKHMVGYQDYYKIPNKDGGVDGTKSWLPHPPHWLLSAGTQVDYALRPEELVEGGVEVPSAEDLARWGVTMEEYEWLGYELTRLVLSPGVPIERQYTARPGYRHMSAGFAGFRITGERPDVNGSVRHFQPDRLLQDLTLAQCDIRTGWHLDGTERAKELLDAKG